MGNTYYVDPAAAGSNNGSDWTNAWTNLQSAADGVVAGDVVYCRGTQSFAGATAIDFDTAGATGSNAGGYVKFIGCNASGNVDGTRFTIDVNNQDCHGLVFSGAMDMCWLENFRVTNTGGTIKDCVSIATGLTTGCVWINCRFDNSNRHGVNAGGYDANALYFRCIFDTNGGSGLLNSASSARAVACRFSGNTGDGVTTNAAIIIGSLVVSNGDDGADSTSAAFYINCVFDSNTDDGVFIAAHATAYPVTAIGCRFTNHAGDFGFNDNGEPAITGYCYFEDNGTNLNAASALNNVIPIEGGSTTTNIVDQANTNEGYTTAGSDFNLRSDATLRRTSITVPAS